MNDSMHGKHDLDLISALVEGELSDPSAAEELVSTCEECARLHRAHLTVREAVAAETPPRMAEAERDQLHASLWSEMQPPAEERSRRSAPWWYRVVPAAAALVVVAGVAGSVYLGGPGGDAATEMAADTTTATEEAGDDDAAALAPLSDEYSPSDGADSTEAPADTAAADEAPEPRTESAPAEGRSDLEEAAVAFRERVEAGDAEVLEGFDCDPPGPAEGPLQAAEEVEVEDEPTWLAGFGEPGEVVTVVAYRRTDCEVLLTDEQGP